MLMMALVVKMVMAREWNSMILRQDPSQYDLHQQIASRLVLPAMGYQQCAIMNVQTEMLE